MSNCASNHLYEGFPKPHNVTKLQDRPIMDTSECLVNTVVTPGDYPNITGGVVSSEWDGVASQEYVPLPNYNPVVFNPFPIVTGLPKIGREHQLWLRNDFRVDITLPEDITGQEVERLRTFLETIAVV